MHLVRSRLTAAIVLALALHLTAAVGGASAAAPECGSSTGRTMVFVAHEDDNLLFMDPRLQSEFESGRCVRTVFLTAGDDGQGQTYWQEREVGMEAALALMDGVADAWTGSTVTTDGHALRLRTLSADPRISIVFMRLPDGGGGEGFPLYGMQSLRKVWYSHHPCSGCVEASTISSDDGANTFDYGELVATLTGLMGEFEPRQIFTQNYEEVFDGIDHDDHVATALFTREAQKSYLQPHRLIGFWDYNTETLFGPNVTGAALAAKKAAFYTYSDHDPETCNSDTDCEGTQYANWLEREYVRVEETHGAVADAGFGQEVTAGQLVTLDGSESTAEGGGAPAYEWTQVGGPEVTLSDVHAEMPTFTMISHPTLLTFQLKVTAGGETSPPDLVRVRVPASDPAPVAEIAAVGPVVAAGTRVKLDGSGSWDPNSLPLTYEWRQMDVGTPVVLSSTTSPTPEFVAPAGPTRLGFELVVSNGTESSQAAKVEVEVAGAPPEPGPTPTEPTSTTSSSSDPTPGAATELPRFTSAGLVHAFVGRPFDLPVTAAGSPAPEVSLGGVLPPGLAFSAEGAGGGRLAGTPRAAGHYTVPLNAVGAGTTSQQLRLVLEPLPRLSTAALRLPAGKTVRRGVAVTGPRIEALRCRGGLPRNLRCVAAGDRVRLVGRTGSRTSGAFDLGVVVSSPAGTATRHLHVHVSAPIGE